MPEGAPKRKEADDRFEELDAALNPAKNYPRKRVAVACEVCRLRKTRCDAKRPCGFCTESGIECVYRQLSQPEKHTSASEVLLRIEERLARLEDSINASRSESVDKLGSFHRTSVDTASHPVRPKAFADGWRSYYQQVVSVPHYDFSFRQTAGEAFTARPSLVSFTCPYYMQFESWDDTEKFYDDEFTSEAQLCQAMDAFGDCIPTMDPRSIWGLQKLFVKNFLQWLPLLAVDDLINHVKIAQTTNFASVNASSSLSMFAFAFAEISEDKASSHPDLHRMKFLPGLEYYRQGCRLLRQLPARDRRTIEVLQCRILNVSYLQCAILPILAWDAIMEVGRDCMHILSSGYYKNMEKGYRESFHRIFWISSIMIHELESVLKMHPTGIRQYHEVVPLPLTETEVEGFYYFFAQVSLRKLLTETLDVVGYRVGQVIYAPVVAAELRKQAKEWYDHLPPPVRFPINTTPLFDLRKSFLRIQFAALHAVILWPSVLQLVEAIATRGQDQAFTDQLRDLQKETRDCIEYCILNCELAEELVMQRHQGLQFTIWSTYATMTMLMVTYRVAGLAYIPETRNDMYIRKAYTFLSTWEHLPVLRRGLERTRMQMRRAEIPVDDLVIRP